MLPDAASLSGLPGDGGKIEPALCAEGVNDAKPK